MSLLLGRIGSLPVVLPETQAAGDPQFIPRESDSSRGWWRDRKPLKMNNLVARSSGQRRTPWRPKGKKSPRRQSEQLVVKATNPSASGGEHPPTRTKPQHILRQGKHQAPGFAGNQAPQITQLLHSTAYPPQSLQRFKFFASAKRKLAHNRALCGDRITATASVGLCQQSHRHKSAVSDPIGHPKERSLCCAVLGLELNQAPKTAQRGAIVSAAIPLP